MKRKIISKGAEAILIKEGDFLIKKRERKTYRINEIDNRLRKLRTRHESNILNKLNFFLNVPKIIDSNEKTSEIKMEFIKGKKISDFLEKFSIQKQEKIMEQIGKKIKKLHSLNIIHSDLTTSNMILRQNEVFLIDFGLSFFSLRIEDKAVDLHLLKQALESKHFKNYQKNWESFLKGYHIDENSEKVLKQLRKVETRGKYKH